MDEQIEKMSIKEKERIMNRLQEIWDNGYMARDNEIVKCKDCFRYRNGYCHWVDEWIDESGNKVSCGYQRPMSEYDYCSKGEIK